MVLVLRCGCGLAMACCCIWESRFGERSAVGLRDVIGWRLCGVHSAGSVALLDLCAGSRWNAGDESIVHMRCFDRSYCSHSFFITGTLSNSPGWGE